MANSQSSSTALSTENQPLAAAPAPTKISTPAPAPVSAPTTSTSSSAPTNLSQYYSSQGQALPSVANRAATAAAAGVTGPYTGTAAQNAQVLAHLMSTNGTNGSATTAVPSPATLADKYNQTNASLQQSGVTPPDSIGAASKIINDNSPQQPYDSTKADTVLASDAAHQQYINDYNQSKTSAAQTETLTQQYGDLMNQLGIPALNTQLINMKSVMDGTEQDIRDEITKAGGFATNSQVLGLTSARNKTMIQNYNNLLQTRDDAVSNLNTMIGLSEKDRAYATQQIDSQLNFDQSQIQFADKALQNAQDTLNNTAKTYGWDSVYKSALASGDPHAIARINSTMGNGFDLTTMANENPLGNYSIVKGGTDAFGNTLPDSVLNTKTGETRLLTTPTDTTNTTGGTSTDTTPQSSASSNSSSLSDAEAAIVGNESGGNYSAVSPVLPSGAHAGERSYGKYQVLQSNIPAWTKAATGTAMTPEQFLKDPAAQDAVANQQIATLWNKYGNIRDVASVWFTGLPEAQAQGKVDQATGMTAKEYIDKAEAAFNTSQKLNAASTTPIIGSGGTGTGTQKLSFDQYGLLANTDFNPSNIVDSLAQKYIDQYIKNGSVPTASSLGRSMKPEAMAQVDTRARDLYYKATGTALPNPEIIKGYQKIIDANNTFANNLKTQEQTVQNNFGLNLQNLKENDLNISNVNAVNSFLDNVKQYWLGNPDAAQYALQNSTVQNEVGSLLAVRNSSGTTVHDKLVSAGLIPKGASYDQQKAILNTLLQEANNAKDSLAMATGSLYKQVDPLMQDPNNPAINAMKVETNLNKQGLDYNSIISRTPSGQIAVMSKDGKVGYITPQEFDSNTQIKL